MEIKWTKEQLQTFKYNRANNLLISAAAGSGKTTVMTQRIVRRLASGKVEPDRIVVMTFTELAALQMAQKIESVIRKLQEEAAEPEKKLRARELVRQLPAMKISTIHSFCKSVITDYISELTDEEGNPLLEPGYQVLKEEEKKLLLDEATDDVLNTLYRLDYSLSMSGYENDSNGQAPKSGQTSFKYSLSRELPRLRGEIYPFVLAGRNLNLSTWLVDFRLLSAAIAPGYDDLPLRSNLTNMLGKLRSMADYGSWVQKELERNFLENKNWQASPFVEELFSQLREYLEPAMSDLAKLKELHYWERIFDPQGKAKTITGLADSMAAIAEVLPQLADALKVGNDWDAVSNLGRQLPHVTVLKGGSGVDGKEFNQLFNENISRVLALITSNFQNSRGKKLDKYYEDSYPWFSLSSKEVEKSVTASFGPLCRYFEIILLIDLRFQQLKLRKNKVDFNDFEHYALQLLKKPQIHEEYTQRFQEIYIDEYQDTSSIQEAVIKSFAANNICMVGDIKQSIYRFRYANPDLFRAKQGCFIDCPQEDGQETDDDYSSLTPLPEGYLINLNRNFRSVPGIIDFVNSCFSSFLSKDSGEIEYDDSQALVAGRKGGEEQAVQLLLAMCSEEDDQSISDEDSETIADESQSDKRVWEEQGFNLKPKDQEAAALLAAAKIRELTGRKKYSLKDIAILAPNHKTLDIWRSALIGQGINVAGIPKREFLDSPVLRQLEALVQVLDNSRQDFPLTAVLLSGILGERLSEEELLSIAVETETVLPASTENAANDSLEIPPAVTGAETVETEAVGAKDARVVSAGAEAAGAEAISAEGESAEAEAVETEAGGAKDARVVSAGAEAAQGESVGAEVEVCKAEGTGPLVIEATSSDLDDDEDARPQSYREPYYLRLNAFANSQSDNDNHELKSKLAGLLDKIEHWRLLAEDLTVHALLTRIIADSSYADYLEHRRFASENLADLESFLDWVKGLEQDGPLSVGTLARYIHNLREKDESPEEIEPAVSARDAVQVMTVHASKGLEFPVVFLAGLDSEYHRRGSYRFANISENIGITSFSIDPEGGGIYLNIPHQVQLEAEMMAEKAEKWRLLYVAMTRAEDHLYLVDALDKPYGNIADNAQDIEEAVQAALANDGRLTSDTLSKISDNRKLLFYLLYLADQHNGRLLLEAKEGVFSFPHLEAHVVPREKIMQHVYSETLQKMTLDDKTIKITRTGKINPQELWLQLGEDPAKYENEITEISKILSADVSGGELAKAPGKITVTELKRTFSLLSERERVEEGLSSEASLFPDMSFQLNQPETKIGTARARMVTPAFKDSALNKTETVPDYPDAAGLSDLTGIIDLAVPDHPDSASATDGTLAEMDAAAAEKEAVQGSNRSCITSAQLGIALHTVFQFLDFGRLLSSDISDSGSGRSASTSRNDGSGVTSRSDGSGVSSRSDGSGVTSRSDGSGVTSLSDGSAAGVEDEYLSQLKEMVSKQMLLPEEMAAVLPFYDNARQFALSESGQRLIRAEAEGKKVFREQPFTLAVPALTTSAAKQFQSEKFNLAVPQADDDITLLQGMIDLWFLDDQGLILIDFKSDYVPSDLDEATARVRERYYVQIESYAEAIRRATGIEVTDKKIWLIRPSLEIDF